jgi:hypothetical protein
MTLPLSGAISLNQVNVELGLSGTTTISMNQASVRTLFGVPSGAISMSDGYGKSNAFSFTISSNQTNANLRTLAVAAGWPGTSAVNATINSGIYISSNGTGTPALTVNGSFPNGVSLINNGIIVGMGGNGGNGGGFAGAAAVAGTVGSVGGTGLSVSVATSVTNNGTIAGGGGGGGGGRGMSYVETDKIGSRYIAIAGGGGGGGRSSNAGSSTGGAPGTVAQDRNYAGSAGSAGNVSAPGAGGNGGYESGLYIGGAGGTGGGWGVGGATGALGVYSGGFGTAGPYAGGASGNAISGNANITYIVTGTRLGPIT